MTPAARLVVALDVRTIEEAAALAAALAPLGVVLKIGLGLTPIGGVDLARRLAGEGTPVFLDMKYFDIGATIENAVARSCELGVDILTIHGDPQVVRAAARARDAAAAAGARPAALHAITVLTSLTQADVDEIGFREPLADLALRRAVAAKANGADGVIASPHEAAALRDALGEDFSIITPGVRSAGAATHDQARVATPAEAIRAGANRIVVGRQIIHAPNPHAAAEAVIAEITTAAQETT